jgi:hypothetical protein
VAKASLEQVSLVTALQGDFQGADMQKCCFGQEMPSWQVSQVIFYGSDCGPRLPPQQFVLRLPLDYRSTYVSWQVAVGS